MVASPSLGKIKALRVIIGSCLAGRTKKANKIQETHCDVIHVLVFCPLNIIYRFMIQSGGVSCNDHGHVNRLMYFYQSVKVHSFNVLLTGCVPILSFRKLWCVSTKTRGYQHDSADVSIWLINRIVGSLVPFLSTLPFSVVATLIFYGTVCACSATHQTFEPDRLSLNSILILCHFIVSFLGYLMMLFQL